jgi:alkylated DNA nucleotide flippase Atl1
LNATWRAAGNDAGVIMATAISAIPAGDVSSYGKVAAAAAGAIGQ